MDSLGTILDVMPWIEKILGFSNRWYRAAMEAATTHKLFQDMRSGLRRRRTSWPRKSKRSRVAGEATSSRVTIWKI